MANKFVSFLETLGHDFKIGLQILGPIVKQGLLIATAAEPLVAELDPGLGSILSTTVATVCSIEQKFAAMGQQSGTGMQKLSEATTILQPVISQAFAAAGKASDAATVGNYISAVVGFLNAIPAMHTASPAAGK
jgi:hypothetical protein